jgi:hypothetical protein
MTQATRVHSTPPTNTPIDTERRRFLAVAAGASVVSVGTLAVAAAIPAAALAAVPTVDPIYAAIEAHRKADAAADVVFAGSSRLYRLAGEMVGPRQIEVPNMVEPGTTAKVWCYFDVERVIPHEQYPDLNDHYCKLLKDRCAALAEIHGDTDELTEGLADAAWDARDRFAETVPTSLPGLLAMIVYANELAEEDPDAFSGDADCTLLQTLAMAAKALIGRPA